MAIVFNPFTGNFDFTGSGSSGLTVGTTTITSGTNGRFLYDNSGVVGEATVTGTLGNVVLSDTPTLTTPNITTSATLTRTSVGTTSADGLVLTNTTAAAAGAQQYSPRLRLTGQGWKTNATAASQTVDWIVENQPVQGAANPSANLLFLNQVNAGGYASFFEIRPQGQSGRTEYYFGVASGNRLEFRGAGTGGSFEFNAQNINGRRNFYIDYGGAVYTTSTGAFGWASSSTDAVSGNDLFLYRDAANTLAQRNSTNAQTFRIYNTYTSSTNYELAGLFWSSNVFHIGAGKGSGGGTARVLQIDYGGTTTSAITVPAAITGTVVIAGGAVGATTAITLGGATQTATSGTYIVTQTTGTFNPSSTSTMVAVQSYINPTINYSAGTPGAGSYEALKIAAVETALPTGTNYLIRASAGATGFTDKFLVRNNGAIYTADTTLLHTIAALTDGAAAATATMTNAPAAGNPTKWIPIDDNGTTRYIPAW